MWQLGPALSPLTSRQTRLEDTARLLPNRSWTGRDLWTAE